MPQLGVLCKAGDKFQCHFETHNEKLRVSPAI